MLISLSSSYKRFGPYWLYHANCLADKIDYNANIDDKKKHFLCYRCLPKILNEIDTASDMTYVFFRSFSYIVLKISRRL